MAGKRMMITLPEKVVQKLEAFSEEKALSKSVIIALALDEYYINQSKKERSEP